MDGLPVLSSAAAPRWLLPVSRRPQSAADLVVRRSTLFLALPRPALSCGVPVEAIWGNVLGTFDHGAFLQAPTWWPQPIRFWLLGIPFHIILRELTALDYHWARTIRLQL